MIAAGCDFDGLVAAATRGLVLLGVAFLGCHPFFDTNDSDD
jgi:hypothetical protein